MATKHQPYSVFSNQDIPKSADVKVGIVVSEWNGDITEKLFQGAYTTLLENGVSKNNIFIYKVPGAFELPLACKMLINKNTIDGVIAIGVVIQGETKHFDYVCQGTTQGLMQCQLDTLKPISFCLLTDQNKQQSIDRSGGKYGNKGIESAITCLKMIHFIKNL
ncbi:MAG: 6,7-dimethyl-8-ribityllumazine synthase [Flavobacteriia bacterium]|nr:6,7-dimethyl-8-ribityllumazine synthase [Flavobacteriia bacterium]